MQDVTSIGITSQRPLSPKDGKQITSASRSQQPEQKFYFRLIWKTKCTKAEWTRTILRLKSKSSFSLLCWKAGHHMCFGCWTSDWDGGFFGQPASPEKTNWSTSFASKVFLVSSMAMCVHHLNKHQTVTNQLWPKLSWCCQHYCP